MTEDERKKTLGDGRISSFGSDGRCNTLQLAVLGQNLARVVFRLI
jgi:hypothetical protein